MGLADVAETVFRIDEVVAGIELAVVLQRHGLAAHRRAGAHLRGQAERLRHGGLEHVDVQAAEVLRQPFRPHRTQEVAIVAGIDRPLGDDGQRVIGPRARGAEQRHVGRPGEAGGAQLEVARLDAGRELDAEAARDRAQVAIDLERCPCHVAIDHAQQGEGHLGRRQPVGRGDDAVVGRLAALGRAVAVVQLAGAVHAEADDEAVRLQEGDPFVVEQQAVGLQVVLDALAGLAMACLQFDHAAEEVQPHHRGLAALPGEHHLVAGLGLDVLADVGFQQPLVHARVAAVLQQVGLVQVETVRTVEVAQRAGRLDHHVVTVVPPRRQGRQVAARGSAFGGRAHAGRPSSGQAPDT